jgi:hypothetical protein
MERQDIGFIDFFKEIPDHRKDRCKLHSVEEILLVTFWKSKIKIFKRIFSL